MTTLAESLNEFGFAPVIALMKSDAGKDAGRVRQHFVATGDSILGASAALERSTGRLRAADDGARVYPNLGIIYGTVDRAGLTALKGEAAVAKVTPAPQMSLIRPTARRAAALSTKLTWGLETLGVADLWAQGLTGENVRVAHLDTGVDASHPALKGALVEFAEFDRTGRLKAGAKPSDSDHVDGHGTHTAGTIAGRPVRGRHVGVAPGASLLSAMVIEGGDIVARILGGLDWAVGQKVQVLSMSLGIRGWTKDFLDIADIVRASGILPVIAIGNEGPGTSRSPGNYPQVLSVGAHDDSLAVADFSSSQRFVRRKEPLEPDVLAPGVGVLSAKRGGGWQELDGTSMATPHVAGLAALLFQAKPDATVSAVERAIFASARKGPIGKDRASRGPVNAGKALAHLTKS